MGNFKNHFGSNDYWIGYRFSQSSEEKLYNGSFNEEFKILPPSFRYWYADPMILFYNNQYYVFTEVFDRFKKRGYIGVSFYKNRKLTKPKIILKEPFHLSFPNTIIYNNNVYMIPECSEDKSIRIYEMQQDVYHWKLVNRFESNQSFVDTAFYCKNNNVFLLTSEENINNKLQDKIKIFEFDHFPNGNIKPCNIDFKNNDYQYTMRNAGNIIRNMHQNKNYRVSQISTPYYYGKNMRLYEIQGFSNTEYCENNMFDILHSDLKTAKKPCESTGTHTYSCVGALETVDFFGTYYSLKNIPMKMIKKIFFK